MKTGKELLLHYREKHRLTQTEMAEKIGIARTLLVMIESGNRAISHRTAALAEDNIGLSRKRLLAQPVKRSEHREAF